MRSLRFCVLVTTVVLTGACSQISDVDFDFGILNAIKDPIRVFVNTNDLGVVQPAAKLEGTTQIAVRDSAATCCGTAPTSDKHATATFVAINTLTQESCTKERVELQEAARTTVVIDYSCNWRSR